MISPHITVEIRSVYGKDAYYPACPTSHNFAKIAGTKTLTREVLQTILNMGYCIDYVHKHDAPTNMEFLK